MIQDPFWIWSCRFHDAGTYDAKAKTGGANGSIRNELNSPANNGIKVAVDFCGEPNKQTTCVFFLNYTV